MKTLKCEREAKPCWGLFLGDGDSEAEPCLGYRNATERIWVTAPEGQSQCNDHLQARGTGVGEEKLQDREAGLENEFGKGRLSGF